MFRLLAAMAFACVLALPCHARENEALAFLAAAQLRDFPAVERKAERDQAHRVVWKSRTTESAKALKVARRYLGTNPTGWQRLWCAQFVGLIEKKIGRAGTGSALAKSYAKYGRPVPLSQARPGDIVVTARKGGGHVGYLVEKKGKTVRLISGNSGGRGPGRRVVAEGDYPVSRIIAVRRPG